MNDNWTAMVRQKTEHRPKVVSKIGRGMQVCTYYNYSRRGKIICTIILVKYSQGNVPQSLSFKSKEGYFVSLSPWV